MTSGSGAGGRLLASFPVDVRNGGGIGITKQGLATRIAIDLRQTQRLTTLPLGGIVPVQDPLTGLIGALPVSALPTAQTGDGSQTNAKLATMPPRTFKANLLSTTAAPQDVNFAQVLEALGITSGGSVATTAANVSVVPPASQGYTNVQGAVTSIEGRILKVGTVAGTAAAGDDARFAALSNPIYDRQATGGHSRTFIDSMSDRVNVLEFLTAPMVAGTADCGPALNAAALYCKNNGRRAMYLPTLPSALLLRTPVNLEAVHLIGDGTIAGGGCEIVCDTNVTMFSSLTPQSGLTGLALKHLADGIMVDFPRAAAFNLSHCTLRAEKENAVQPMMRFGGSNVFIDQNAFTNYRTNGFCIDGIRTSPDLMINHRIFGNYFGGPAKGIRIGTSGTYPRPEGTDISHNMNVLTGGPFIELNSILSLRIHGNMIDQGHARGAVLFSPQGTADNQGIFGVTVIGNFISSGVAGYTAPAIRHEPTQNYCVGISIVSNEICTSGVGCFFGAGSEAISISANLFYDLGGPAVRCSTVDIARKVRYSPCNVARNLSTLSVDSVGNLGSFRDVSTVVNRTDDGNWSGNSFQGVGRYILIPHLLACAPPIEFMEVDVTGAGVGATYLCANIVSADDTYATVSVQVFGLANHGGVQITIRSAISQANR